MEELIKQILTGASGSVVLSVIMFYYFRDKIQAQNDDIEIMRKEQKECKIDCTHKHDTMQVTVNDLSKQVINAINDLKIEIAKLGTKIEFLSEKKKDD